MIKEMIKTKYENIDLTKFIFKINFTHRQKIANCFPKIKLKSKNNKYDAVVNNPFWGNITGYCDKILVLKTSEFYDLYCKQFCTLNLSEEKQKYYCKVLNSSDINSIKLAYDIVMNSYFEGHINYKKHFISFITELTDCKFNNINIYKDILESSKVMSLHKSNINRLLYKEKHFIFTESGKKHFEWFAKLYISKFTSLKSYRIEYFGKINHENPLSQEKFKDILTENF